MAPVRIRQRQPSINSTAANDARRQPSSCFSIVIFIFKGIDKLFVNYLAVYAESGEHLSPIGTDNFDSGIMKVKRFVGQLYRVLIWKWRRQETNACTQNTCLSNGIVTPSL